MADLDTTRTSTIDRSEGAAPGERDAHRKTGAVTFRPPLDLYDFGDRYELRIDMPGTTSERIDVTVHDGVLSVEATVADRLPVDFSGDAEPIHGEFGIGDYRRQIRLGEDIDVERLTASYAHGVLQLMLPKRSERQPRRVTVTGG